MKKVVLLAGLTLMACSPAAGRPSIIELHARVPDEVALRGRIVSVGIHIAAASYDVRAPVDATGAFTLALPPENIMDARATPTQWTSRDQPSCTNTVTESHPNTGTAELNFMDFKAYDANGQTLFSERGLDLYGYGTEPIWNLFYLYAASDDVVQGVERCGDNLPTTFALKLQRGWNVIAKEFYQGSGQLLRNARPEEGLWTLSPVPSPTPHPSPAVQLR